MLREAHMSPARKKPVRGVQLRLNRSEAVVLYAATRLLAEMSENLPEDVAPKTSLLERLEAKLREALADTSLAHGERLAAAVIDGIVPDVHITDLVDSDFSAPMYDIKERLPILEQARRDHRTTSIEYYSLSREAVTTRRVDPYHLGTHAGQALLIGFCHERQAVRIFRVDRIKTARLTDDRFPMPAGFDADQFLRMAGAD
jgi:predicted DNA-binding transcriptional regulator YafY